MALPPIAVPPSVQDIEGKDKTWIRNNLKDSLPDVLKNGIADRLSTILDMDPNGKPKKADRGIEAYLLADAIVHQPQFFKISIAAESLKSYRTKYPEAYQKILLMRIRRIGDTLNNIRKNPAALTEYKELTTVLRNGLKSNEKTKKMFESDELGDDELKGNYIQWFLEDLLQNAQTCSKLGQFNIADFYLEKVDSITSSIINSSPVVLAVSNIYSKYLFFTYWSAQISTPLDELKTRETTLLKEAKDMNILIRDDSEVRARFSNLLSVNIASSVSPSTVRMQDLALTRPVENQYTPASEDFVYALNGNASLHKPAVILNDFLNENLSNIPAGTVYLLGGGDGGEARAVASRPSRLTEVLSIDESALATDRVNKMVRRMALFKPLLIPVVAKKTNVTEYPYIPNSASLVVAHHLFEYLQPGARKALANQLKTTLKENGKIFIVVHLNGGRSFRTNFQSRSMVDLKVAKEPNTYNLVMSQQNGNSLPRYKHFFSRGTLQTEFEKYGFTPANGYNLELKHLDEDRGGYETEILVITRKKAG